MGTLGEMEDARLGKVWSCCRWAEEGGERPLLTAHTGRSDPCLISLAKDKKSNRDRRGISQGSICWLQSRSVGGAVLGARSLATWVHLREEAFCGSGKLVMYLLGFI